MANGSIPVYMRAGRGDEVEIGTVSVAPSATTATVDRRALGQLLRAAADELDPPAPDERAQPSPRDRQVRGPRRTR